MLLSHWLSGLQTTHWWSAKCCAAAFITRLDERKEYERKFGKNILD